MSSSNFPDKRADNRLDICLPVELTLESGEKLMLCTRDMSSSGVFLEKADNEMPPIGTIVWLKLTQQLGMGDAPVVKGKIVRETDEGVGVSFINP